MKITNRHDLPEAVVRAIIKLQQPPSQNPREYRVTELVNSVRQVILYRRHWHEMEKDASELLHTLSGQSFHFVMQAARVENALTEEEMHFDYNGFRIWGHPDHYKDGLLEDYKDTKVWAVRINGGQKFEWEFQLNLYARALRELGFPVHRMRIIAKLKDWNAIQAEKLRDYPRIPMMKINFRIWSDEEVNSAIGSRLKELSLAEIFSTPDGVLPECTAEEMWESPTTFVVKKKGNKRAQNGTAKIEKIEEAMAWIDSLPEAERKNYVIEERPGERKRCAKYCDASRWCNQYHEYLKEKSHDAA